MRIQITKNTIFSFIISFTFISTLTAQYLQEGLYPDCSYVIVDEQGWKIHKNQDGKTISMTPKDNHNTKTGKYSFDKFGNLVPFKECIAFETKNIKNDENIDIKIDIELNFLNIFKGIKVYGGLSMPFGSASDMYSSGFGVGGSLDLGTLLTGEVNLSNYTGKDGFNDLNAAYGIGYLNKKISEKAKLSVGGGLAKLNNGTGISGITSLSLNYTLPLNLGLNLKYNKFIGLSRNDGSVEFDYELLDSFNMNLYYTF